MENHVNKIRRLVPPTFWSHCSGRENLADLLSRGMTPLSWLKVDFGVMACPLTITN